MDISVPQATPKRKVSYFASEYTHVCVPEDASQWDAPTAERRIKGTIFYGDEGHILWGKDNLNFCPHCGARLPQTEAELARAQREA